MPLLSAFGAEEVVTSPWARCRDTVAPYAEAAGLDLVLAPQLTEDGAEADPRSARALVLETLRTRSPPKWPEQAVEIFFREFADEDADLQLKIAEKALTDDNKAMVFVKMTPVLRRHWVGRLREVHMRNLGGGLGLGGRVGEEGT